ncbi:MAG: CpsD/CapB family tyrosine-protein kinase [Clostridiales bacterium]|nr:CpsD/CapB family tyrosine-protein kinase [Clostridiales bacterium]
MSENNINANDMSFVGSNLGFEGKEAYNLLRTNILYSVKREGRSARVIGMTSSVHGEGKSLTAINLACSIADSGRKVLLVECDMRLPTLRRKLGHKKCSGLSHLLAGMDPDGSFLQQNVMTEGLDIIFAGETPPNPSELLASSRFGELIEQVEKDYSFIILDLPPVCEVSDALIVSKLTDGMIVVVRQDYSRSTDLAYAMRQLNYVNAKIIGFVYNGAGSKTKRYKYKYGKSYSKS